LGREVAGRKSRSSFEGLRWRFSQGKKSKVGLPEPVGNIFSWAYSEANTLRHHLQILPQLTVAKPNLISGFTALERRQRRIRELTPSVPLHFFQFMDLAI
jgi:hypothetical protein